MCATQINECMHAFITELPHCLGLTSEVRTLAQFTLPVPDITFTHHWTDIALGTHSGTCRWLHWTDSALGMYSGTCRWLHWTDSALGMHSGTCRWLQHTVTEWHIVILINVKTIHSAFTPDITANILKQYATPCPPVLTVTCFFYTIHHIPASRTKPLVCQEHTLYAL
jgi:hypothetical protein